MRVMVAAAWLVAGAVAPAEANSVRQARLLDVAVLEDASRELTIDEVAALPPDAFDPLPAGALARGYSKSAHWLRFTVVGPAGEWWLELLPAFLDDLRLFEPAPLHPGTFLERRAGDTLPFAVRDVPHRGFVFKLHISDEQPQDYFLRIETTSTTAVYPRVLSPEEFVSKAVVEQSWLTVAPVVVFAVMIVNLAAWSWLQDRLVPAFVAYAGCGAVVLLTNQGIVAQHVLPNWPALNTPLLGTASCAAIATGHLLYRRLLGVTKAEPVLYWLYTGLAWGTTFGILPLIGGYQLEVMRLVWITVPMMTVVGALLAIRLWWRGGPGGLWMLIANVLTMAGFLWFASGVHGATADRAALLYGIPLSAMGSVVALHLVVTERYRLAAAERQQAMEEAARERRTREAQGRFLDVVSHEYRTPLAVLQTNLDILSVTDDVGLRTEGMRRMSAAVERLRDIFSGAQQTEAWAGHHQVARRPLDLDDTIARGIAHTEAAFPGFAARVRVNSPRRVHAMADATLLETIVGNLLTNAAKYATPGSQVVIDVSAGPGGVVLRVENACVSDLGVSAEEVLRGGVRGRHAGHQPGLGMGLSMCRRLATDMGAMLALDLDEPGRFVAMIELAPALEATAE